MSSLISPGKLSKFGRKQKRLPKVLLSRSSWVILIGLVGLVFVLVIAWSWLLGGEGSYRYAGRGSGGQEFKVKGEVSNSQIEKDFWIIIPKIGVSAPVRENVDGAVAWAVAPRVLKGVGHYRRGPLGGVMVDGDLPGGRAGNIFLFGHSQILGRDPRKNYSGVFNDLEELKKGDKIDVYYQGKKYTYQVKSRQVVDKTDLRWVTDDGDDIETLTLMSCWPLGLDWKRYVVQADRIG